MLAYCTFKITSIHDQMGSHADSSLSRSEAEGNDRTRVAFAVPVVHVLGGTAEETVHLVVGTSAESSKGRSLAKVEVVVAMDPDNWVEAGVLLAFLGGILVGLVENASAAVAEESLGAQHC